MAWCSSRFRWVGWGDGSRPGSPLLRVKCVISDVCPPCACHLCSSLVHWGLVCAQLMMVHKVLMSNINFSVTIASLCGCQLKWFVSCYCHFCCIFCSFHLWGLFNVADNNYYRSCCQFLVSAQLSHYLLLLTLTAVNILLNGKNRDEWVVLIYVRGCGGLRAITLVVRMAGWSVSTRDTAVWVWLLCSGSAQARGSAHRVLASDQPQPGPETRSSS